MQQMLATYLTVLITRLRITCNLQYRKCKNFLAALIGGLQAISHIIWEHKTEAPLLSVSLCLALYAFLICKIF